MVHLVPLAAVLQLVDVAVQNVIVQNVTVQSVNLPSSRRQEDEEKSCPEGWERISIGGSCYKFVEKKRQNWFTAAGLCRSDGGLLVQIETPEEQTLLTMEMERRNIGHLWTEGSDISHEGHWRWMSTLDFIGPYQPWYPPNPDNFDGDENCMEIRPDYGYLWNDRSCWSFNQNICEERHNTR